MDMRVRQTRDQVLSGAVYDDRVGRYLDLGSRSNFRDAVAPHQYGLTLIHASEIQWNDVRVRKRNGLWSLSEYGSRQHARQNANESMKRHCSHRRMAGPAATSSLLQTTVCCSELPP